MAYTITLTADQAPPKTYTATSRRQAEALCRRLVAADLDAGNLRGSVMTADGEQIYLCAKSPRRWRRPTVALTTW